MSTTAIFSLFLTTILSLTTAATSPPPSTTVSCTTELTTFSQCLPYVSSPPNNLSESPSSQCCHVFASSFSTCLCHLVRTPSLLGFPVNLTRLFSLRSLCPSTHRESHPTSSLEAVCAGSPTLPPLLSIGPGLSKSNDSSPNNPPSPSTSSPQGSADHSIPSESPHGYADEPLRQSRPSGTPPGRSCLSKHDHRCSSFFSPGIIFYLLLYIFMSI